MRGGWRQLSGLAKAGYLAATVLTVITVAAGLGAYGVYRHLEGNVRLREQSQPGHEQL